jgi:recombination protein RecA
MVYQPYTFEDGLKMLFYGLKGGVDLIVVDSVAAMMPKAALEKNIDKEATIGFLARAMSYSLPKITNWLNNPKLSTNPQGTAIVWINQSRSKIGGTGRGDNTTTPGGWALKFFCFLRLKYTRIGSEVVERKDKITGQKKQYPYGNKTIVKIIKNTMDGKQGHATNIFIRFGQGIDEAYTLIEAAKFNKLIKGSGAWYTLGEERFNGREALRRHLQDNPKVFKELRTKVMIAIQGTAEDMEAELSEEDAIKASFEDDSEDEFGDDNEDFELLDEKETDGDIDEDSALADD